jgi:hypothetical protein
VQGTKEKSSPLSNNKCLSNKWKNSVLYFLRDFEGDQMQTAAASFLPNFKELMFLSAVGVVEEDGRTVQRPEGMKYLS